MTVEGYPADLPHIALIGKAGAGKDTVADLLRTRFRLGYQRVALADPLKDIASILWGPDARTDRDKLQKLGVAVREIHESTWVDLLLKNINREARHAPNGRVQRFVVTDVRFPNEFRALKEAGFMMLRVYANEPTRIDRLRRIGKLQDEVQLRHASETALDGGEFYADWVLTNESTEDDLVAQLTTILRRAAA
ncbi:MAG: AAA family ATPase [Mycobacteriaceae bacterium]